ncbi:MAG: hypothetical protein WD757_03160 [Actinomycetota bacterium]
MNDIQRVTLRVLAERGDNRWGRGRDYLFPLVRAEVPSLQPLELMEALWDLQGRGFVFTDFSQSAPQNWKWRLSSKGQRMVESGDEYRPEDPDGYVAQLRGHIPEVDDLVVKYATEALRAHEASCFLASSVMMGVASERAFQLLGDSFGDWLDETDEARFRKVFDNSRATYVAKFAEFRKRLEPRKSQLPPDTADGLSLVLDAVLDLLRVNRNDAGHPTGRDVDRGASFVGLQMLGVYLERLYALRAFFISSVERG